MFDFIFFIFFIGIIVACLQDLKRREVDYWLVLFLLLISFSYVFYRAIFESNVNLVFQAGFALIVMFIFMNIFYYGRVFAGGDANLLFAMTVFFIGATFYETLINIGLFLLVLMFSGSVYGLLYSFVLYFKNFKRVNKDMKNGFREFWFKLFILGGLSFLILGIFNSFFLIFSVTSFLLGFLFVFVNSLENISMVRTVSGKELREGDWLVEDIKVGNKIIKADWDGLDEESIKLLFSRKYVRIKDGLPFVPAFLIAFILYSFLRDWFFYLLFILG